mmetsp:Transcript_60930/g.125557  ORF Transcript_60930/g.125557 Transcript_60930/m.125557 type:complete len:223 (+) Transcript_60930:897-1565(+)
MRRHWVSPYQPMCVASWWTPTHWTESSRTVRHTRYGTRAASSGRGRHEMLRVALLHSDPARASMGARQSSTLSAARHMGCSEALRGRQMEGPTTTPRGMPGSSSMKIMTRSRAWGSWAMKVYSYSEFAASRTHLNDVPSSRVLSLVERWKALRVPSSHAVSNGVASPVGPDTNTGGAWMLMRQQCWTEARSPLEWSRIQTGMSSPLGFVLPTHRFSSARELS